MKKPTLNALNAAAYNQAANVGAAPGAGSRARTQKSEKDKQRDNRNRRNRQRDDW